MKTQAWRSPFRRFISYFAVLSALVVTMAPGPIQAAPVLGTKKVMVLRVYFQDYAATSRYTQVQVQGFFSNLDTLWQNTSYTKINVNAVVSARRGLLASAFRAFHGS